MGSIAVCLRVAQFYSVPTLCCVCVCVCVCVRARTHSHVPYFTSVCVTELPESQVKNKSLAEQGRIAQRGEGTSEKSHRGTRTKSKTQTAGLFPLLNCLSRSAGVNLLLTGKPRCRGNPRDESGTRQASDTKWAHHRGPGPAAGLLPGSVSG